MQFTKILLGTTATVGLFALVSADVKAADGTVSLEGFLRFEAYGGDLEEKDAGERFDFATDSEVHVTYEVEDADSGLRYGGKVEFEADSGDTSVDENYLFVGGGFGELRFGNEDGASDNGKIGGFSVAAGTGGIDGEGSVGSDAIALGNTGDNTKIRYDSPQDLPITVGVSYTPNSGNPDASNEGTARDPGGDQFEDFVEGAIVFGTTLGDGLDLQASVVAGIASGEGNNIEDFEGIGAGAQIGFGGFEVAAGYFTQEGGLNDVLERDIVNAGIGFDLGPAAASVTWNYIDDDSSGNEENNLVVSATADVVSGLVFDADISFFDEDIATGEDGVTFVTRLGVSF